MKESAYNQIVQRYGRPSVDVFSEFSYRVILWDWHIHGFATHGQLSGHGESLTEACADLLKHADASTAKVARGYCNSDCHEDYNKSPAGVRAAADFRKKIR